MDDTISFKEYVDGQLAEVRRAVEVALAASRGETVTLQEHVEAIMAEHQRATELAAIEREKAAAALREQLTDRIAAGDTNLREHIAAQIAQLRQMVEAAEAIAQQRHDSLQREARIQHAADQAAIAKAEHSNEARFAAANEWRGQSADRERTQQEQIASFVATLTPLSRTQAVEDKLVALIERDREDIQALRQLRTLQQGQEAGIKASTGFILAMIGAAATMLGIVIVLANIFTG